MRTLLLLSALALTGCYQKHLLFEAESLSMTMKNSNGRKLRVMGPVEEKWCRSETPVLKQGTNEVGMADQVIYKAQKGGKRADFIVEARVWTDTDGCAIIEGKLAKAGAGGGARKGPGRRKPRKS